MSLEPQTPSIRQQWQQFLGRWSMFVFILLSPWSLGTLVVTVLLLWALSNQEDPMAATILTLFLSLSTGVLGAVWQSEWARQSEMGRLVTKGRSAVRGLRLLSGNVEEMEKRVAVLQQRQGEAENIGGVEYLEEVRYHCQRLQEAVINSIEEWVDIVPEVQALATQLSVIRSWQAEVERLAAQGMALEAQLAENKGRSLEEIERIETQLQDTKARLRQTESELSAARTTVPLAPGDQLRWSFQQSEEARRLWATSAASSLDEITRNVEIARMFDETHRSQE